MGVGAVVLAAGNSERMGQNKLLLLLNGKRVIDNILDALAAAGIGEQVVVLGHSAEEVTQAMKPRSGMIKTAVNPQPERGMLSSFQVGLQALGDVEAAFLVLGDEPIFDPAFLQVMIKRLESKGEEPLIVSPVHEGKKGHPLLFRSKLIQEILRCSPSQTIRDVVHAHADGIVLVEAPKWTVMDMDTPEDYRRLCNFANQL